MSKGFTVIELVVVLSMVALLAVLSIPSLTAVLANNRQQAALRSLHQAAQYARSLAISEGRVITLCGSTDGVHCAAMWQPARVVVFVDNNKNGRLDEGEHLYRDELISNSRIEWRGSNSRYMRYYPEGYLSPWGSYTYCPDDGDSRYIEQLVFNRIGRAYQRQPSAQQISQQGLCR